VLKCKTYSYKEEPKEEPNAKSKKAPKRPRKR